MGYYLISSHFTEIELGVDYEPVIKRLNAKYICDMFLERVRFYYNKPIYITSGYRNIRKNESVGGKRNSWHLYEGGKAAVDFYVNSVILVEVFDWLRLESYKLTENLKPIFDKIILEKNKLGVPVIIHAQLDRFNNPRREAYIGETGDYKNYTKVDCL